MEKNSFTVQTFEESDFIVKPNLFPVFAFSKIVESLSSREFTNLAEMYKLVVNTLLLNTPNRTPYWNPSSD